MGLQDSKREGFLDGWETWTDTEGGLIPRNLDDFEKGSKISYR